MLFTIIEGAKIILASKGHYKQADVYVRDGKLYAKWGSGFIGLRQDQRGTTLPNVRWEHLEGVQHTFGEFGIMLLNTAWRKAA